MELKHDIETNVFIFKAFWLTLSKHLSIKNEQTFKHTATQASRQGRDSTVCSKPLNHMNSSIVDVACEIEYE